MKNYYIMNIIISISLPPSLSLPLPLSPSPPSSLSYDIICTTTHVVHGPKGKFGHFEGKHKRGIISKTKIYIDFIDCKIYSQ